MSTLQALVLGIIQGLTEFLPVSSSAHLTLTSEFLGWSEQSLTFDVFLHGATLVTVIYYFRYKLYDLAKSIFKGYPSYSNRQHRYIFNLFFASLPAALVYLFAGDLLDSTFKSLPVIGIMLIIFGIPLLYIDSIFKYTNKDKEQDDIKPLTAYFIGAFQALALIRGVSRSGATLIGGILTGLKKDEALEFAFIAGIPVIAAGFLTKLLEFIQEPAAAEGLLQITIGSAAALITGLFALKLLMSLIDKPKFRIFGLYRIVLGSIILLYYYL